MMMLVVENIPWNTSVWNAVFDELPATVLLAKTNVPLKSKHFQEIWHFLCKCLNLLFFKIQLQSTWFKFTHHHLILHWELKNIFDSR